MLRSEVMRRTARQTPGEIMAVVRAIGWLSAFAHAKALEEQISEGDFVLGQARHESLSSVFHVLCKGAYS